MAGRVRDALGLEAQSLIDLARPRGGEGSLRVPLPPPASCCELPTALRRCRNSFRSQKALAASTLPQRLWTGRFWVSEGLSSLSEFTGLVSVNIKNRSPLQRLDISRPCCGLRRVPRLPRRNANRRFAVVSGLPCGFPYCRRRFRNVPILFEKLFGRALWLPLGECYFATRLIGNPGQARTFPFQSSPLLCRANSRVI